MAELYGRRIMPPERQGTTEPDESGKLERANNVLPPRKCNDHAPGELPLLRSSPAALRYSPDWSKGKRAVPTRR